MPILINQSGKISLNIKYKLEPVIFFRINAGNHKKADGEYQIIKSTFLKSFLCLIILKLKEKAKNNSNKNLK